MTKNEVGEYIRYRLKIAGSEQNIFTSEAIRQIFSFSGGCPRLINIICDHALLNGWPVRLDIDREKQGCRFIPDETFCAIGALLDNRYWLKTTDGWRNQREHEDYKILEEGRSYKFTKHVARWCDLLAKPLGQRFEIVPLQDPTRLKQGDRLPVRIFFEGKPAIGGRVAKTSNMEQTHRLEPVQAEAPFIVTIGPPGLQLINAKLAVPIKKGHVTWFAASLTFRTNQTPSK